MLASLSAGATQLAASAEGLFLLDGSTGEVYRVDLETGELTAFNGCDLAELAEDGYALDGLRLEAMSGLVNLYAVFAPEDLEGDGATGAVPTFNFGEEASAAQAEEPARAVIRLAASWEVEEMCIRDSAGDAQTLRRLPRSRLRGGHGDGSGHRPQRPEPPPL